MFDRNKPFNEKEFYLTVLATYNGTPQLYTVCRFKVTLEDVNDNEPVFDKVAYTESVPQDLRVDRMVMRVHATDIDDGNNSVIRYSLSAKRPDDAVYFRIDEKSGVIFLNKGIDQKPGYKFNMTVTAQDQAKNPKSSVIDLDIRVVKSHKKAPAFRLKAVSNDNASSSDNLLFELVELVTGGMEQTNKRRTFRYYTNDVYRFVESPAGSQSLACFVSYYMENTLIMHVNR